MEKYGCWEFRNKGRSADNLRLPGSHERALHKRTASVVSKMTKGVLLKRQHQQLFWGHPLEPSHSSSEVTLSGKVTAPAAVFFLEPASPMTCEVHEPNRALGAGHT